MEKTFNLIVNLYFALLLFIKQKLKAILGFETAIIFLGL